MINGYILEYKYKDRNSLTLLNHKLYGRLSQQKQKGIIYRYYLKGMLHNTKYVKLKQSKLFLIDDHCLDRDTLNIFTQEYKIYKVELNLYTTDLYTGLEYWQQHVKKNKVIINGWKSYRPKKNTTKFKNS